MVKKTQRGSELSHEHCKTPCCKGELRSLLDRFAGLAQAVEPVEAQGDQEKS